MTDEEGQALIRQDYRVNLLVQMIMEQYNPAEIDFSYQVITVLSLSILAKFYNLQLTDEQKDKLVSGLALVGTSQVAGDGSFLPEIPSLVLCLHLLQTESNKSQQNFVKLQQICQICTAYVSAKYSQFLPPLPSRVWRWP